jgi:hypothetical protein
MHSTRDMSALMKALGSVVKDHVAKAFSALSDRIKALEDRAPIAGEPGQDGKDGKDGASVTVDDVLPLVSSAVESALASWPKPQDGKDGANGENGKDGIDGKSFTAEDAEPIIQRAIERHVDAWALSFERRASDVLQRAIDRMPAPKDGKDGENGKDGIGFDDVRVDYDGERGFSIVFEKDGREIRHDVRVPAVIDRGVYKSDAAYEKGDGVTHQGSYWIAQSESPASAPGMSDGWRLAVKKGRDGRHGKDGEKGERGAPGRAAQGI